LNRNITLFDDPLYQHWERMRAACPVHGEGWYKFMEVTLKAGENIKAHKHKHHLVMYYPEEAEPIIITPEPGTMLYLPPGTLHEVRPTQRPRLSIAMLIDVEKP